MTLFDTLIEAATEQLLIEELTGHGMIDESPKAPRLDAGMQLSVKQLVCAIGFHPRAHEFSDSIITMSGFSSRQALFAAAEKYYRNDQYEELRILNLLGIYSLNKNNPGNQKRLRKHLRPRMDMLEKSIAQTISPRLINSYKAELSAIYLDGIADFEFANERLNLKESGFRAMTGEILLIAKSKLIPIGNILFSNIVTAEEKRQLLRTGIIPRNLAEERLQEKISPQEKNVLLDFVRSAPAAPKSPVKDKDKAMPGFASLLNASSASLLARIQKLDIQGEREPIKRISLAAGKLGLNHLQLVCAIGFNPDAGKLEQITRLLGFRLPKLLLFRLRELFISDIYTRLVIDNILDIYALYGKTGPTALIDSLLAARLQHLESKLQADKYPARIMSYKMELRALYNAHILPREMVRKRMEDKSLARYRQLSRETLAAVDNKYLPANNLFFLSSISPEEKSELIVQGHISADLVKNRLQNKSISKEEREMLENHI